jgi:DNA-binding MarR family transcriptional regulator
MAALTVKEKQEGLRQNEKKWTPVLLEAGWSMLPNVILERQQALGLDPVDVNILLHLVRYWWYAGELPFPSKKTIAECIGIDPRTVQRHIAAMERGGLINRVKRRDAKRGQQSNYYDLTGLIREATPYAREAIEVRKRRREEDATRRVRKARLQVLAPE